MERSRPVHRAVSFVCVLLASLCTEKRRRSSRGSRARDEAFQAIATQHTACYSVNLLMFHSLGEGLAGR